MNWPRTLLIGSALAGLGTLSLLASACGASSGNKVAQLGSTTVASTTTQTIHSSTTATGSALAFAQCMRSHGVSNFPDPDSQGNVPALSQQALGVSMQTTLVAQQACKSLLPRGGSSGTPAQRQQKIAFGLQVAQCLRTHGFPTFPDPSGLSQGLPPGIDPSSPQFQLAQTTCEQLVQQRLGLR